MMIKKLLRESGVFTVNKDAEFVAAAVWNT